MFHNGSNSDYLLFYLISISIMGKSTSMRRLYLHGNHQPMLNLVVLVDEDIHQCRCHWLVQPFWLFCGHGKSPRLYSRHRFQYVYQIFLLVPCSQTFLLLWQRTLSPKLENYTRPANSRKKHRNRTTSFFLASFWVVFFSLPNGYFQLY